MLSSPESSWHISVLYRQSPELFSTTQVNGMKKEKVTVPVELTRSKNHSKLQREVVCKALEGGVLSSNLTVAKVLISSRGHVVDIITSNSLPTGVY